MKDMEQVVKDWIHIDIRRDKEYELRVYKKNFQKQEQYKSFYQSKMNTK